MRVYAQSKMQNFENTNLNLLLFLKEYLTNRMNKKEQHVNIMVASIAFSSFFHRQKFFDCDIFFKFLNKNYKGIELMYFLFVR